jgi:hypothetical protein
MSSWPASEVDWHQLTPMLRDGEQVCVVHGRVAAVVHDLGLAACPRCHQLLTRVRCDGAGVVRGFAEAAPVFCSGPDRHRLTGGRCLVGWSACDCDMALPGPGGHRTWTCRDCAPATRFVWPPCTADGPSVR